VTRIALVTAKAALGTDDDLEPLLGALTDAGLRPDAPCWDDADVEWSAYDLVVLRSPWDYVRRYDEFMTWLQEIEQHAPVLNPSPVVRWNTNKRYLEDLGQLGLPVAPTTFFAPDDPAPVLSHHAGQLVVKPVISAGSKDTARHSDPSDAEEHARALLDEGREVMVQPYLDGIDSYGETGMVFFDGVLSHAFRKAPILALDAPPTDELFASEEITPREPTDDERRIGEAAISACGGPNLLYGRVDVVPGHDASPVILEVELTEPSYFVAHGPGSAERFAAAVQLRMATPTVG
jgi:O-ureido-D-serine cyclo-ligase